MGARDRLSCWQSWVRQPQRTWLRRAIFQVHLWCGIALGLYVFMISVTGSVLVYRNELLHLATPAPLISQGPGPILTDDQLRQAAIRVYPGYRIQSIFRPPNPDQAVEVDMDRGGNSKKRLFDSRSGGDLGDAVPAGMWAVSELLDLHDNLLAGPDGRRVNALGALALAGLAITGLVIWWPGINTWRRSLKVPSGLKWKRSIWHLHSMIGFWSIGFVLLFAASGVYLGRPEPFDRLADWLQPPTAANAGTRTVDQVIYWLAYLHFGRIKGIGIPCKGPGLCDQATKAVWTIFGSAPAAMFVTGVIMWWNRIRRPHTSNPTARIKASALLRVTTPGRKL